jgi:hypothetical protein
VKFPVQKFNKDRSPGLDDDADHGSCRADYPDGVSRRGRAMGRAAGRPRRSKGSRSPSRWFSSPRMASHCFSL